MIKILLTVMVALLHELLSLTIFVLEELLQVKIHDHLALLDIHQIQARQHVKQYEEMG